MNLRGEVSGRELVVRADASTASGTGHMMRALALAQGWRDADGRVRWLTAAAPPALVDRLLAEDVRLEWLSAEDGAPIEPGSPPDADRFRDRLLADPASFGVVDGQWFDSTYLAGLDEARARLLVVDDGAELDAYPVALVLNQNAHAGLVRYPASSEGGPRYLLGLDYVLLRREFLGPRPARTIPQVARHLLVTFGGADPTGMTAKALAALARLPAALRDGLRVRVLVGAANTEAARLAQLAAEIPDATVQLDASIDDMPGAIGWADLALSSGGTTVWELAHGGCPTLVVETVPIEERLVEGLREVRLFGHLGRGDRLSVGAIADELGARIGDREWRATMSERGQRLVDGGGTARVIGAIAEVGR